MQSYVFANFILKVIEYSDHLYCKFENTFSKLKKLLFIFYVIIFLGCSSTNISVKNNFQASGKKIGIGGIKITAQKKANKSGIDTVCICTAQSTEQALISYLQQAGFRVIDLPINDRDNKKEIMRIADSAKVDYILTGIGVVDIYGKSKTTFMQQLTIQIQEMQTGEIITSASFTGTSVHPVKAAAKIGEQLVKKIK